MNNFLGMLSSAGKKVAKKVGDIVKKAGEQQDKNAAMANMGYGMGGTAETNSNLAANNKPAQAAIEAERMREAAGTNKEKQAEVKKFEEEHKEDLDNFTQKTASENAAPVTEEAPVEVAEPVAISIILRRVIAQPFQKFSNSSTKSE